MSTFLKSLKFNWLKGGGDEQFQVNLCSRYRSAVAPLRLLLIGSCVLLVSDMLWNLAQAVATYQECRMIEDQLQRVRQQDLDFIAEATHERVDLSDQAVSRLSFEIELANQLLQKRTFSWTKFLTELEQTVPSRLALNSVRLDQAGTMVRVTGAAMTLEDVTAFTVGLQDHAMFKDPILAQHRAGQNGLVEFDVTVQYRQDGV
ncbi:MAG: PilN domain-containing protein [Nitrospira sp.]|nr:PilN domain-containing protein [Nitrospira sp.]